MEPTEIARFVAESLKKRARRFKIQFHVPPDMIYRDEGGLWHVYVEHVEPIAARGHFNDILNEIEEQIETSHHLNVMIVPVKPEAKTA